MRIPSCDNHLDEIEEFEFKFRALILEGIAVAGTVLDLLRQSNSLLKVS